MPKALKTLAFEKLKKLAMWTKLDLPALIID